MAVEMFAGKRKEVDEERSEGRDCSRRDPNRGLDHGPFYEVDAEPGVVVFELELADVDYADYCC